LVCARQMGKDLLGFLFGQNCGEAFRPLGAKGINRGIQWLFQYVTVQLVMDFSPQRSLKMPR